MPDDIWEEFKSEETEKLIDVDNSWEEFKLEETEKLIESIKAQCGPESEAGTSPCPVCGHLAYWRYTSYDRATAGSCSQDGCIGWMEKR